jgi:MFS family permease
VVFAGELLGSLAWGPLADLHGRKWVYLCGCAMVSLAGLSSGLTSSFSWLLIFRGLVGVGIGKA